MNLICYLLKTFANSLDPDQLFDTLIMFLGFLLLLKKSANDNKNMNNCPACKHKQYKLAFNSLYRRMKVIIHSKVYSFNVSFNVHVVWLELLQIVSNTSREIPERKSVIFPINSLQTSRILI